MTDTENVKNRVKAARLARGWSQDDLALRSGLSRSGISAIEIERLVPSAAAALLLAKTFGCRVEDLFTLDGARADVLWASPFPAEPCRYWQAEVAGRQVVYPADAFAEVTAAHDGTFDGQHLHASPQFEPERTLVMACCDPAVVLLQQELARHAQIRLLVIPRSSTQSLDLLQNRLVHVAGVHLSPADEDGNGAAVEKRLGAEGRFSLLRAAQWEEGLAIASGRHLRSVRSVLAARLRWIGREPGSGARQCFDEIRGPMRAPRHHARSHRGVADAIRAGLADAGVCLRLVSDQAGLDFLSVRQEAYDLCFAADHVGDPRIQALIAVIRSPGYRKLLNELPGYSAVDGGGLRTIGATPARPTS